jgi:hypothetical protein
MEFSDGKFWRLAPRFLFTQSHAELDPKLDAPAELVQKLTPGAGIVVASWDAGRSLGHVRAIGVVLSLDKAKTVAVVDWRGADFALSPSAQGASKWRTLDFFKFAEAPARRYRLKDRFADAFGTNIVTSEADWGEPSSRPASTEGVVASAPGWPPQRRNFHIPRRNRVAPTGQLIATKARGTLMGNRADRTRWLVCDLHFERQLNVPRKYTKLFFLDEAVALSAGHRPCSTCRRPHYEAYRAAVEAECGSVVTAPALDRLLSDARTGPKERAGVSTLPDGVFVAPQPDDLRLVWQGVAHRWTPHGYTDGIPLADLGSAEVEVVTPRPSVAALRRGYQVGIHRSVTDAG